MAKLVNPFLEDIHPPFDGFPKDALKFFRDLKKNNNREWFMENKQRYEQNLREPMESLLAGLAEKLRPIDSEIVLDPKKAIFRIYRDIRFSKDKTPYKTHIAASFSYQGPIKSSDAGFYFQIDDKSVGLGGGMYMPSSDQLKTLRTALANDTTELEKALKQKDFVKLFGRMEGEKLSRIPQGFPKDHPAEEFLRMKQFLCWKEVPATIIYESSFLAFLAEHFIAMAPLVLYLVRHS